ncbi:MAG: hypothetical protein WC858_00065 [Parcubacteria group bacterium]|jgi:hypothetical protein
MTTDNIKVEATKITPRQEKCISEDCGGVPEVQYAVYSGKKLLPVEVPDSCTDVGCQMHARGEALRLANDYLLDRPQGGSEAQAAPA